MAFVGQLPGRPRLTGFEILQAVLLHLKPRIDTAKKPDRLLDVRMVPPIDLRIREDLVASNGVFPPALPGCRVPFYILQGPREREV